MKDAQTLVLNPYGNSTHAEYPKEDLDLLTS